MLLIEVLSGQLQRRGSSREEVFGLLDDARLDLATFALRPTA